LGRSVTKTTNISEQTMQAVDAEVRRIIDSQYKMARDLIESHSDQMHAMAKALLDWETIDADQIADIMSGKPPRAPKDYSKPTQGPDSGSTGGTPAVATDPKPSAA
jgi:cell division protease FtsH